MRQRLGQHFLKDQAVIEKIADSMTYKKGETIVEVGPGKGVLTAALLERGARVIAIEWDEQLAVDLIERFPDHQNLQVVQADIRSFDLIRHLKKEKIAKYNIAANLPYYLSSFFLRQVFQYAVLPQHMVLLLQREVAERLVASPGSSDRSVLSVMTQLYSTQKIVQLVPASAFVPPPKVESAVVVFTEISNPFNSYNETKSFFRLIKAGFGAKRKTILNALSGGLHMEKSHIEQILSSIKIDPNVRAQDLTLEQWRALHQTLGDV